MIDLDWLKEKLIPFIKTNEADKVGIIFFRTNLEVSRFANSQIHQHVSDEDQIIYFRVLLNGRLGVASTNSIDEQNLKDTFKKALQIARLKLDSKLKREIPSFKPIKRIPNLSFRKTIELSAYTRTRILQKIFADADRLKISFSGNLYNGQTQIAIISPQAKINYQDYSFAGIKFIAVKQDSSGYASQTEYNIERLDPKSVADIAIRKCLAGKNKIGLSPKKYDVILEPAAVAELIAWLNYIGFGAKSFFEETSFLHNRIGKRITKESITIYDYGQDRDTLILPFDFEGIARMKRYLIKKGIAQKPLCDSYYGRLLRTKSTGHANFPDDTEGPIGHNLVMEAGDTKEDKIIGSAKRAILITRLHYINGFLDTHRALMTGMTRDGTFLIENGKITSALENMRFTESILEAFSRIKYISKERKIIADYLEGLGSIYAPTVYIKDFTFTS